MVVSLIKDSLQHCTHLCQNQFILDSWQHSFGQVVTWLPWRYLIKHVNARYGTKIGRGTRLGSLPFFIHCNAKSNLDNKSAII